ncbi:MAG: FimV/HubP family polar landmark protein [Acidiferrobacterales bacterium]
MGQAFSGVKKGSRLLLAGIVLAVTPLMAEAVGLGRLKVKSALNEPLNAEIPLTDVSRRDVRSLEAGLAPRSQFEALGIERPSSLSNIKFTISKRLDGTYFIQLTTRRPYAEPFLHMLVQLDWAGGRLSREYTALIDPPYLSSARPSSITAPRLQTPAEDYEPLPEPLSDEKLKESSPSQIQDNQGAQTMPAPMSTLPAPLPEEPKLIGKSDEAATTAKAEPMPEPALPEPITSADSGKDQGKSIDQIEAETFGADKSSTVPKEPEIVSAAPAESMPEPMTQASSEPDMQVYDDRTGLLGPPNVPIIPVEPEQMQRAAAFWAESDQYKVKRGDTLYEIAQHLRKDSSVTLNQVMMALYETNPRAFYGNNVNNLRAGRILQVPDIGTVKNRSVSSANRQFKVQYDAWQEHKMMMAQARNPVKVASEPAPVKQPTKTAKASTPAPANNKSNAQQQADAKAKQQAAAKAKREAEQKRLADAKAKQQAAAKAKREAEQKRLADAKAKQQAAKQQKTLQASKTAKAKQTEELLRIVRASMLMAPTTGATAETESSRGAKEQQVLAKRMDSLEESAESQKLKNQEMATKAGKVQKNIESEKRLIDIENPSLAKSKPAQPAAKPADKAAATKPAANKKPVQVAQAKRPIQARVPPKPKEVSIVDTILETLLGNQFVLMAIGAVVLLGAAIMAIYMKRRRKSLADFEESILSADTTDDLSTDSQEDLGGESGDTSFLSDFSQEGMGNIATDEVDPIAEADVYLAYGRDEQAEEILKDAVSKHPDRAELKLKLLEIYHQRNDVSGFETLAEELYASGNAGSVWSQVADMGAQLNPDNPMFKGDAPPAGMMGGGMAPPPPAEPMMGGGDLDMTELVPGEASLDDGSGMDDSLDFDIESPVSGGETEAVSSLGGDAGLDMGLSMGDGGLDMGSPAEEASATESEADEGDFALDFDMDTADFSEESGGDAEEATALGGDEDTGLDFNMDFEDMGGGEESDDSGLSMDSGEGLSMDMGSDDDTGLEFDSGELSMESSDDDLDLSSMSLEEEAGEEDSGMSALDMVKAEGGGLPENEDGSLDFSLSSGADDSEISFGDDDSGLDMSADFGMESSGSATDVAEAVEVSEAVGTADADVDTDDNWDEAATKLDLAKAYIDMGDADGAKSILDEVMAEGNEEQKAQASELAAQI